MKWLSWIFRCPYNDPRCKKGCKCGKSSKPEAPPPAPTPAQTASDLTQAKLQYDPQLAKQAFDIYTDPTYGALPFTQYQESIRQQALPQETQIRNQLLQNIFGQLQSPTGLTPEQQSAIDARRGTAQNELIQAQRNRANLGGGLYGGRAAAAEARSVGELQNQFAEEDITRQERLRQNAIQAALPALQILFPDIAIQAPQFESAVPNANVAYQGGLSARGQDLGYLQAQQQNQAAMQSALYGALGTAAGGALGGLCWVAAEVFDGWDDIRTHQARNFISNIGPKWFKELYIAHGEKVAEFIHDKPILKALIRPLFSLFASIGKGSLQWQL